MHVSIMRERAASGRRWTGDVRFIWSLRVLPARVALFYVRAWRHARMIADQFSVDSAIRPGDLCELLELARGRKRVVELGTGTAWSTIALALDDRSRRVVTYDPERRPAREAYLERAWPAVRSRIEFREVEDTSGPQPGESVDFLFIDSGHDRQSVHGAFAAWRDSLAPGACVVFHDYDHPRWPGVRAAISDLALAGQGRGGMYVWQVPLLSPDAAAAPRAR